MRNKSTNNNHQRYALITGSSSGIGYQYARVMAERGYNLVMVSNEADAIVEKADLIKKEFSVETVALMRDLGKPDAAKELYDTCKAQNLEVEVLINNAGVYHDKDFLKDSEAFNKLILNLHVNTPSMLIYYFGQDMVQRHKGYILNMCSITSDIAVQKLATYGATKRFLRNFSRSIHVEMYYEGVNVTAVCPGAVATNLYNLSDRATKIGVKTGCIITPQRLAKKGVRAMFRGKSRITPGIINHIGIFLVHLLPTGLLRLVRKWGIF
ncbi:MAG: SDR family NAD(P)-dependent oxidoreductase [Bacteroidales bacterium]|nr:SDR family NAD(P)-dependent oxidoreductase [Bacteroidales bacterium]